MVGGRNGARLSALPSLRALPGLPSAVVTGLLFLQVPPYPEVFRDSLHTYKLNEQDTDVRTALPLPLSTPAPPTALLILTLLRGGFSSVHLSSPVALHTFLSCPLSPQRQPSSWASSRSYHSPLPPTMAVCVSPLSSRPSYLQRWLLLISGAQTSLGGRACSPQVPGKKNEAWLHPRGASGPWEAQGAAGTGPMC